METETLVTRKEAGYEMDELERLEASAQWWVDMDGMERRNEAQQQEHSHMTNTSKSSGITLGDAGRYT